MNTLPPELDNLPLHRLFLDNNPLSEVTVRWAFVNRFANRDGAIPRNITYSPGNAYAHMQVLRQLYRAEENASDLFYRIESCDLDPVPMVTLYNGKDVEVEISAKEAIKKFLISVPVADGPQQEMYGEPAKAFLEEVLGANGASREARQHELAQMAPCLGNCGTPIESFIRQLYLGKRIMAGTLSEKDEKLLEREAVQEAALGLAHFRFDEKEGIEVMRGLLNAIYMDNAENNPSNTLLPISGERSRLPALLTDHIDFPFEVLVGKKELINEYVDMTCRTDKEGRPVLDADGKYQLNGKKLMLIADGYKLARALPCSPLGQSVLQYGQEMRLFLQDPDVAHLSIEHADVPSVEQALYISAHEKELKRLLTRHDLDTGIEEVVRRYQEQHQSALRDLAKKYLPGQVAGPAPQKEDELAQLRTAVIQKKRPRSDSPGSGSRESSPERQRQRLPSPSR